MVGVVLFSVRSLLMFTSVNRSNLLNANYKQLREQFKKLTGKEQKRLHREGSFERRNLLQFNTRIERRIIRHNVIICLTSLRYHFKEKRNLRECHICHMHPQERFNEICPFFFRLFHLPFPHSRAPFPSCAHFLFCHPPLRPAFSLSFHLDCDLDHPPPRDSSLTWSD